MGGVSPIFPAYCPLSRLAISGQTLLVLTPSSYNKIAAFQQIVGPVPGHEKGKNRFPKKESNLGGVLFLRQRISAQTLSWGWRQKGVADVDSLRLSQWTCTEGQGIVGGHFGFVSFLQSQGGRSETARTIDVRGSDP